MNTDLKSLLIQTGLIDTSSDIENKADETAIFHQIEHVLSTNKSDDLLSTAVRHLVEIVGLNSLLPDCYAKFQLLVTEGMIFFLMQLPPDRLTQKIMDQLQMPQDTLPGQRINTLIKDMPTLQKLGQMDFSTIDALHTNKK